MSTAGYSPDLAFIHHEGFTEFVRQAAPALLALFRKQGIGGGLAVDLGCGTGVWTHELTEAGFAAVGVDISPSMIRLARKNAPRARFVTASLRDYKLPDCEAVTAIGEIINYAFDPELNRRSLYEFFRGVFAALRPGGVFAFDFAEPGLPVVPPNYFLRGQEWAVLVDRREDKASKMLARSITSFRRVGKLYRRTDEVHVLRLYSRSELLRALQGIGFQAAAHDGYGRAKLPAAHAAIIARKPVRLRRSTRA